MRTRLLLVVVACVAATACASDDPKVSEVERVELQIESGFCEACWRVFAVDVVSGLLELSDDHGLAESLLAEEELTELQDVLSEQAVQAELEEPETWSCDHENDVRSDFVVQWSDGEQRRVPLSDGCFGRCDVPEHPLMRVRQLLFRLKDAHMECPPREQQLQDAPVFGCAVIPEPRRLSERMLCTVCSDDCALE